MDGKELDLEGIEKRLRAATLKEIPGYSGYAADDEGHIWSIQSNWRGYGVRMLIEAFDRYGYKRVRVIRKDKRVSKQVHLLVALAFYGTPRTGLQVRHLDGSKTNNKPTNLAWGTAYENALDRTKHGNTGIGSKNGFAKLDENKVKLIKAAIMNGQDKLKLAKEFGVRRETINKILVGKAWKHVTE